MLQVPICDICEVSTEVYWEHLITVMGFILWDLTLNWNRKNFRVSGLIVTAADFSLMAKVILYYSPF